MNKTITIKGTAIDSLDDVMGSGVEVALAAFDAAADLYILKLGDGRFRATHFGRVPHPSGTDPNRWIDIPLTLGALAWRIYFHLYGVDAQRSTGFDRISVYEHEPSPGDVAHHSIVSDPPFVILCAGAPATITLSSAGLPWLELAPVSFAVVEGKWDPAVPRAERRPSSMFVRQSLGPMPGASIGTSWAFVFRDTKDW